MNDRAVLQLQRQCVILCSYACSTVSESKPNTNIQKISTVLVYLIEAEHVRQSRNACRR